MTETLAPAPPMGWNSTFFPFGWPGATTHGKNVGEKRATREASRE